MVGIDREQYCQESCLRNAVRSGGGEVLLMKFPGAQ
jgi:hypothetical protein